MRLPTTPVRIIAATDNPAHTALFSTPMYGLVTRMPVKQLNIPSTTTTLPNER